MIITRVQCSAGSCSIPWFQQYTTPASLGMVGSLQNLLKRNARSPVSYRNVIDPWSQ